MTNTNTMAGRVKASEEAVPIAAHAVDVRRANFG
jgi:hypothetical protein